MLSKSVLPTFVSPYPVEAVIVTRHKDLFSEVSATVDSTRSVMVCLTVGLCIQLTLFIVLLCDAALLCRHTL